MAAIGDRSVAIETLRGDAKEVWYKSAGDLIPVKEAMVDLELDERDFSKYGTMAGVVAEYQKAWETYGQLVKDAERAFTTLSNDLRAAADRYENTEQANAEALERAASGLE